MSGSADGLRALILENPDDAGPWGVYADWLDEQGTDAGKHIRRFLDCLTANIQEVGRYAHLAASAKASADEGHSRFCWGIITAAVLDLIQDNAFDLTEMGEFQSETRTANAVIWNLDEVVVETIDFSDGKIEVGFCYAASGDQGDECWHYANTIEGNAVATITADEEVFFDKVTAELQLDFPDGLFDDLPVTDDEVTGE
jgi:uncharacterized protein (TIGR02996 family)